MSDYNCVFGGYLKGQLDCLPEKAEVFYRAELEKDPENVEYLFKLGRALSEQGRYIEAAEVFEKCYDLAVDMSEICVVNDDYKFPICKSQVLYELGNCRYYQGQYAKAADYYKAIPEPRLADKIGMCYKLQGKHSEAEPYFRTAVNHCDSVGNNFELGVCLGMQGKHSEAEPFLRRVVELAPNDASFKLVLDGCLKAQGKKPKQPILKRIWAYLRNLTR